MVLTQCPHALITRVAGNRLMLIVALILFKKQLSVIAKNEASLWILVYEESTY